LVKFSMSNMKIGTQILLVTFIIALFTIFGLSVSSVYNFRQYTQEEASKNVLQVMSGIFIYIEEQMSRIRMFRDFVANSGEIAALVVAKDTQSINTMLLPIMKEAGADIAVITDANGNVISRPHAPTNFGDNIGDNIIVKRALNGQNMETVMVGITTKLGYYCSTPIRTEDGRIVGMMRVALGLDNLSLADRIKALFGYDVTFFADKIRVSTTLTDKDGKRAVGTEAPKLIQEKVLRDGEVTTYPITLFGTEYFTAYSPLRDPESGKIVGMYFAGKPVTDAKEAIRSTVISITIVSVFVFVVALFISIRTAKRISKPLGRIVTLAERCHSGDLTIRKEDFNYNGGGELGALVNSLSEMVSAQLSAMSQVFVTSSEISKHAESLSSLSNENATAMSNSASLISEASGLCDLNDQAVIQSAVSISELGEGANSVAQMSTKGAESLAKTTQMSKSAANSVNELVDDIKRVNKKTNENQEKIHLLSDSVAKISNFMGVIASIADQTNLLALNAAIEAARAGEAGRGFAVVAEEVRKLAEDSRTASKNVEELVALLSQSADEAISASEQSVTIVNEIMSKAEVTSSGLNRVLSEITNVNEAIQSIAAVAQEQAASSSEISRVVKEIEQSTDEITKMLSELNKHSVQGTDISKSVSDSALQMAQSVVDLKGVLAQFKIS